MRCEMKALGFEFKFPSGYEDGGGVAAWFAELDVHPAISSQVVMAI